MQKQNLSEIKPIEHANELFLNEGPLRKQCTMNPFSVGRFINHNCAETDAAADEMGTNSEA